MCVCVCVCVCECYASLGILSLFIIFYHQLLKDEKNICTKHVQCTILIQYLYTDKILVNISSYVPQNAILIERDLNLIGWLENIF